MHYRVITSKFTSVGHLLFHAHWFDTLKKRGEETEHVPFCSNVHENSYVSPTSQRNETWDLRWAERRNDRRKQLNVRRKLKFSRTELGSQLEGIWHWTQ